MKYLILALLIFGVRGLAEDLSFSPEMKYLSPIGYARLRLFQETGCWESNPLGVMKSDPNSFSKTYHYLSVEGLARLSIYERFGYWVSLDTALALSDFGDDTFSFWQRLK